MAGAGAGAGAASSQPATPSKSPPPSPPPPPRNTDEATLTIVDPPNGSTLKGDAFDLKVSIEPVNGEVFTESYNTTNSRVCVSIDDGPYSCWPVFGGRIRYINAIEGEHNLYAVLMKRGEIVPETTTPVLHFTTVENPDIEKPDDEGESESSAKEEEDEKERVKMDMPQLNLQVPPEKVTLPGSSVQIVSKVSTPALLARPKVIREVLACAEFLSHAPPFACLLACSSYGQVEISNSDLFEEYFKFQYNCYNVDAATAHACWAIFDDNAIPYMTKLEPGLHTVDGMITHPETRLGIKDTLTDTRTFYTAGDKNEAAELIVEIEVDDSVHKVAVAKGSDASNQGFYFCGMR